MKSSDIELTDFNYELDSMPEKVLQDNLLSKNKCVLEDVRSEQEKHIIEDIRYIHDPNDIFSR